MTSNGKDDKTGALENGGGIDALLDKPIIATHMQENPSGDRSGHGTSPTGGGSSDKRQPARPEDTDDDGSSPWPVRPEVVRHFPEDPHRDGIFMASFDAAKLLYRKDVYFHAKLLRAERVLYEKQDIYLLSFEVSFMGSFSPQYRFRGADIDLTVQRVIGGELSHSEPSITKIIPSVIAVDVSEHEVNKSNEVTAGAGASAGGGQLNTNVTQTNQDKITFKGRRKFHGLIKNSNHASWRLYEEEGSLSAIPALFRLAAFVRCPEGKFEVQLKVSVRMVKWPKLFGLHKLYFNSSFSAEPITKTIEPLPTPIDWLKLYEKAKAILPKEQQGYGVAIPMKICKNLCKSAEGLDDEERWILADFTEEPNKVTKFLSDKTVNEAILEALKEFLASKDESGQAMKRLWKSMGISSSEEPDTSSKGPAKEDPAKMDPVKKDEEIKSVAAEDSYRDILARAGNPNVFRNEEVKIISEIKRGKIAHEEKDEEVNEKGSKWSGKGRDDSRRGGAYEKIGVRKDRRGEERYERMADGEFVRSRYGRYVKRYVRIGINDNLTIGYGGSGGRDEEMGEQAEGRRDRRKESERVDYVEPVEIVCQVLDPVDYGGTLNSTDYNDLPVATDEEAAEPFTQQLEREPAVFR